MIVIFPDCVIDPFSENTRYSMFDVLHETFDVVCDIIAHGSDTAYSQNGNAVDIFRDIPIKTIIIINFMIFIVFLFNV